nr:ATP-binding cassette domain-containing protein [Pseudomonadales bacterium]
IGLYSKANAKQMAIAEQWLLLLGLNDKAGDSFASLSYGEQRILLIARAMVKHPALLLLDEPCMGLDEANRALVLSLIDRICEAGPTTLVYVSHHEEDKIAAIERELDLSQEN